MDELKEVWGELKRQKEPLGRLTTSEIRHTTKQRSSGVIEKLHQKVKIKFYFAVFFTIAFGAGIPFAFPLASRVLLLVLWMAYLIGSILLYQEKNILQNGIDMSQDLLHGLKACHQRVKRVLHYEELIGLTLYPVSASGGFLLGMQAVDRDAEIMNKPADWLILIIMLVVLTPGAHWLTRKMNTEAFGKYLTQLEKSIEELENEG